MGQMEVCKMHPLACPNSVVLASLALALSTGCLTSSEEFQSMLAYASDLDGDGFAPRDGDCDDADAAAHPGAVDIWYDGVDSDCDGRDDHDADEDGFLVSEDCDDQNPRAAPGLTEACDGVDEDCDGEVDEGLAEQWFADADGDGFGDPAYPATSCLAPEGFTANDGDCDDGRDDVFPGAVEVCGDGAVNDCDATSHECQLQGSYTVFGELDGGSLLLGNRATDRLGRTLSTGGDVDGDGLADVLLGATGESSVASEQGAAYLVTRARQGELHMPGDATAVLLGEAAGDWAGKAVAIVPDVNGDGLAELAVAASGIGSGMGMVYFVTSPVAGTLDLGTVQTTLTSQDILVDPVLLAAGDPNGDGQPELLLGSARPNSYAGAVYLVPTTLRGTHSIEDALLTLRGERSGDQAGVAADAGDLDGDGIPELLIGAPDAAAGKGRAYVVKGPVQADLDLADADALCTSDAPGDELGRVVNIGGDVDEDGRADFLIGAPEADSSAGAAYLFSGLDDGALAPETAPAVILGAEPGARLGIAATLDADLDGDGQADLVLSADRAQDNGTGSGSVYVFYDGVVGTLSTEDAALTLMGPGEGASLGVGLAGGTDMNGDGLHDLAIGALGVGGAFIVHGQGP